MVSIRAIQILVFLTLGARILIKLLSLCHVFGGFYWPQAYREMYSTIQPGIWGLIVAESIESVATFLFAIDQGRAKFRSSDRCALLRDIGIFVIVMAIIDCCNIGFISGSLRLLAMIMSCINIFFIAVVLGIMNNQKNETSVTEHNVWRFAITIWFLEEIYVFALNITNFIAHKGRALVGYSSWGICWITAITVFMLLVFGFFLFSIGPFLFWFFILLATTIFQFSHNLATGIVALSLLAVMILYLILAPILLHRIRSDLVWIHDRNVMPKEDSDLAAFPPVKQLTFV